MNLFIETNNVDRTCRGNEPALWSPYVTAWDELSDYKINDTCSFTISEQVDRKPPPNVAAKPNLGRINCKADGSVKVRRKTAENIGLF